MKELEQIVAEAEKARASAKPAALATVVGIEGSGYRLPGARMLIVDGQWLAGSISGGCLENDVVLRASEAIKNGRAVIATYDTTSDDDIVFGVGLGCKGIITILIEPIGLTRDGPDFIGFAKTCLKERVTGTVATVVEVDGEVEAGAGSRALLGAGTRITDIKDVELKGKLLQAIEQQYFPEATTLISVSLRQGAARIFIERIEPSTSLIVFGAGHDAIPLVKFAKDLGWHVIVVDHRPAYAISARFPTADRIVLTTPEEALSSVVLTDDTLTIVMTHNYLRDLKLLGLLLTSRARYIGLLGPKKRADQLLAELKQSGIKLGPEQLNRLYTPVGLDIGSESPSEVALSILAEMQAAITKHDGGFLRTRRSPIHSRKLTQAKIVLFE